MQSSFTGSFSRLSGIFLGVLLGPCLIAVSFFIMYNMEFDINLAALCKQAPRFSASTIDAHAEQFPLVALTGTLIVEKNLETDSQLIPKPYLAAACTTEVYAWEEHQKTQGANAEEKPPATYFAHWTTTPGQTHTFENPEGHTNPEIHQALETWVQPEFLIGAYRTQTADVQLPPLKVLHLNSQVIRLNNVEKITEKHLYATEKDHHTPHIGAYRKSFSVLDVTGAQATLFCTVQGGKTTTAALHTLVPFETTETMQRLFLCSPDEAIKQLAREYSTERNLKNLLAWILLVAGFICLLGPLCAFTQGIFLISSLIDFLVGFISLVCATLVFVLAKIFVKIITAPLVSISLIAALMYVAWIIFKRTKKKILTHQEPVNNKDQ